MKLNEIKSVYAGEVNLTEGVIPIHIEMTLDQIISSGAITNSVQVYILGGIVSLFKNGGPLNWPRDMNNVSVSSDEIDAIKSLSPAEQVELANWAKDKLHNVANYENGGCGAMSTLEYVKYVLKKQD